MALQGVRGINHQWNVVRISDPRGVGVLQAVADDACTLHGQRLVQSAYDPRFHNVVQCGLGCRVTVTVNYPALSKCTPLTVYFQEQPSEHDPLPLHIRGRQLLGFTRTVMPCHARKSSEPTPSAGHFRWLDCNIAQKARPTVAIPGPDEGDGYIRRRASTTVARHGVN